MEWISEGLGIRRDAMTVMRELRRPIIAAARATSSWTLWLFALNLVWEAAQPPLYALGNDAEWPDVGYAVLHCSVGDAFIAFASYLLAAAVTRAPRWPVHRPFAGLLIVLVSGELFTIGAEWYNVYVVRSWAYGASMPTVLGIGVAPLLQWLVLPAIALAIIRRQWRNSSRADAGFEMQG
jgi:hypothetical protein